MFGGEHALLERLRRIAAKDRHLGPAEDLTRVELFGDDVDRTAALPVARFDRAGVGVETAIFGKQDGMDVDDPAPPLLDEPRRADAHETGERDGADDMH